MVEPYLTNRTFISTDHNCGQEFWWFTQHGRRGITPVSQAAHFKDGIDIHSDLAQIANGVSGPDLIKQLEELYPPSADITQTVMEPLTRRVGWVWAFWTWIWPRLMDDFEVVMAERELVLEHGDLWIANTADLVLRHRREGWLLVIDYKTVGLLGREWINHWNYAIQLHINAKAVERELGERVRYSQVIGLVKGREDWGRLRHPYVWAYSSDPTNPEKWGTDWKRDWSLTPVWDFPDGTLAWVERLGEDVGRALFPFSPPVVPDERLLRLFLDRRLEREKEIRLVREECQEDDQKRALHFEHRFDRCRPAFGGACPFLAACHNAEVARDPIGSGLYVERVPHHDMELLDPGLEE